MKRNQLQTLSSIGILLLAFVLLVHGTNTLDDTGLNTPSVTAITVYAAQITNGSSSPYVQVYKLLVENGTSFPTTVSTGYLYLRTDYDTLCFYDGSGWVNCTTGPNSSYLLSVSAMNFLFQNGTRALTADWNAGAYGIYGCTWLNSTQINANDFWWNGQNRTDTVANPTEPCSYILDISGSMYRMKNCMTGQIDVQDTNASAVFNNASATLGLGGGIISVKAGTYNFTNPIILRMHVQFEGEGQSVTTLRLADGANCNLFEYKNGSTNVFAEIGYMTLTGNNGANTAGSGIYIEPSGSGTFWDLSLKDVFITYFAQYGIYTSQFWGYDFFHVISEFNTLDGIRITGGSSGHIISSKFMSNGQNGLNATGSGYLDWTDCDFRENGYHGVWLNSTAYSFMSCHIIGNSKATNDTWLGIFLYGNAASYTRIISCEFNGKSGTNAEHRAIGIAASGVDGTVVEFNTFYGYGAAAIVNYGTNSMIHYNHGFVTENTLLNVANTTATNFVFNHGCASTVNSVQCSFNLTVAYTWTWTSTTTQVTVTVTPYSGVTLPAVMGILSADVKYIP